MRVPFRRSQRKDSRFKNAEKTWNDGCESEMPEKFSTNWKDWRKNWLNLQEYLLIKSGIKIPGLFQLRLSLLFSLSTFRESYLGLPKSQKLALTREWLQSRVLTPWKPPDYTLAQEHGVYLHLVPARQHHKHVPPATAAADASSLGRQAPSAGAAPLLTSVATLNCSNISKTFKTRETSNHSIVGQKTSVVFPASSPLESGGMFQTQTWYNMTCQVWLWYEKTKEYSTPWSAEPRSTPSRFSRILRWMACGRISLDSERNTTLHQLLIVTSHFITFHHTS